MAKKKDLVDQNPKFIVNLVDILAENDPTNTNKYLPFMLKQAETWVDWLQNELKLNTFKEMFETIKDFEDMSSKNLLSNKDIYSYGSNQEIVDAIKEAKEKITKGQVKKNETIVLHEDDRYLVLQPLTSRSSNVYGKSTKWCVSSEQNDFKKYFNQYIESGSLIFFIDKSVKEEQIRDTPLSKIAFHRDKEKGLTVWNTKDVQLDSGTVFELSETIPLEVLGVIMKTSKGKTNRELAEEKGIKKETF